MLTKEQMQALETLVDDTCTTDVLCGLRDICWEKGDHLRTNWQEEYTAREWDKLAEWLDYHITTLVRKGTRQKAARKEEV